MKKRPVGEPGSANDSCPIRFCAPNKSNGERNKMLHLKEHVEASFGMDAEKRILRFLLEKELAGCRDGTQRWLKLFELCGQWRKQFLLWEDAAYINGIHGWTLSMGVYKLHLPKEDDWTTYLYRMTLLAVISGMCAGERTSLAEGGNFSAVADDYYVNGDYIGFTREQWLAELSILLERSWQTYRRFPGNSPAYHREMKRNYPRFRAILERLAQDTGVCEVVRMNQYGGDDTVWYFAGTQDSFYLMILNDSM